MNEFQGRIQGGGHTRRAPPLKLEKIWFFGVKSWFFTRNTPKIFAPPSAIGNNMIFWRKIVIFHTKYPKNFRASLRSAQFFLSAPPLTWNPGSAPEFAVVPTDSICGRSLSSKIPVDMNSIIMKLYVTWHNVTYLRNLNFRSDFC